MLTHLHHGRIGVRGIVWLAAATLCAAVTLSTVAQTATASATVVVLVRHGEKAAAPADDPELSPAGRTRAQMLALALAEAHVSSIITTPYRRTRDTAAPIALARGLHPIVVEAGNDTAAHARAVADAIRRHEGGTVLVVGHSNTVPAIIRALGGPALPDLCDGEFSALFTLVLEPGQPVRLLRSTYGAPDADRGACSGGMIQK